MLIRIQQMANVDAWVNHDEATGGLADRVRPQDIFVLHTRFGKPGRPGTEQVALFNAVVDRLREAFPCNRLIALNGLGSNPNLPGYVLALAEAHPWALMLDWESHDWHRSRILGTRLPRWTDRFRPNLRRVGKWMGSLSAILRSLGSPARTGLVPTDAKHWEYDAVAHKVDHANAKLGGRHLGVQSVQTQHACMAGAHVFRSRARQLFRQYRTRAVTRRRVVNGKVHKQTRRRKVPKHKRPNPRNLALQISFSDTPRRKAHLPIKNVGPRTADRCVRAGLAKGAGAFFFYANEDSMRALLSQPTMSGLRPPG